MKRRKRGLTFLEVIIVMVLLFLMFYYIYKLLSPGLRVWRESDTKANLQQHALVSTACLYNEIRESNTNSFTLRDYGGERGVHTLVCFVSARDEKGDMVYKEEDYMGTEVSTGEPSWYKYIIYYLDNKSRLRKVDNLSYSTYRVPDGMHMLGEPLDRVDVNDERTNRIIARNIRTLRILYDPSESGFRGFDITVTAYDENDKIRDFSTTLETTVGVRYDDIE